VLSAAVKEGQMGTVKKALMKYLVIGMLLSCYLLPLASYSQQDAGASYTDKIINFPSKFFSSIQVKTVSVKSRVFKKTKLSLLWDFLSYQQMPKIQALVFRVGYIF
jgi:hypothetical protein